MSEDLKKAKFEQDLGPRQKRLIREDRRIANAGSVDAMVQKFQEKKAAIKQAPKPAMTDLKKGTPHPIHPDDTDFFDHPAGLSPQEASQWHLGEAARKQRSHEEGQALAARTRYREDPYHAPDYAPHIEWHKLRAQEVLNEPVKQKAAPAPGVLAKSDMKPKEDKWKEGEVGGDISKDVVHDGKPMTAKKLFASFKKQEKRMEKMQEVPLAKSMPIDPVKYVDGKTSSGKNISVKGLAHDHDWTVHDHVEAARAHAAAATSLTQHKTMANQARHHQAVAQQHALKAKELVRNQGSGKLQKSVRRLGAIDHNGGKIHVMAATERHARHLPALHVEVAGTSALGEDHTQWPKEVHAKIAEAKTQGAQRVIVHEPQGNTVYHQSTMKPAKPDLEKNMGDLPPPPAPDDFGTAMPPVPVNGTNAQPLVKANPLQPPKVPGAAPQKGPKPMISTQPSPQGPGAYKIKIPRVQKSKDIALVPAEKHLWKPGSPGSSKEWKPDDKSSEMDKLAKGDVVQMPQAKHSMNTHNHTDMPAILSSKGPLPLEHVKLLHQAINESDALHKDPAHIPQDVVDYHHHFLKAAIGRLQEAEMAQKGSTPVATRAKLSLVKSRLIKSGKWQVPGMVPPLKKGCAGKMAKCMEAMRASKLAKTTAVAPTNGAGAPAPAPAADFEQAGTPTPISGSY